MSISTGAPSIASIEDALNELGSNFEPGFLDASEEPVMTTPMIVPAAVVTVIGSTLCLVC